MRKTAYANLFASMGIDDFSPDVTGREDVTTLKNSLSTLWQNREAALKVSPIRSSLMADEPLDTEEQSASAAEQRAQMAVVGWLVWSRLVPLALRR